MRRRDARGSHAAEMRFATGTHARQTATSWPSGGQIVKCDIDVGAGSSFSVDSEFDYRDRWLCLRSQLLNFAWYTSGGGTDSKIGGDVDTLNHPVERVTVGTKKIGVFQGEPLYTAKGWDTSGLRGQSPTFFNWAQWIRLDTGLWLPIYLYADNFTGGLTIKNGTAERYQGFLEMTVWEQEGVRIVIP